MPMVEIAMFPPFFLSLHLTSEEPSEEGVQSEEGLSEGLDEPAAVDLGSSLPESAISSEASQNIQAPEPQSSVQEPSQVLSPGAEVLYEHIIW